MSKGPRNGSFVVLQLRARGRPHFAQIHRVDVVEENVSSNPTVVLASAANAEALF